MRTVPLILACLAKISEVAFVAGAGYRYFSGNPEMAAYLMASAIYMHLSWRYFDEVADR